MQAACEVAVARPFLGTLAYRLPATLSDRARPGMRVRVPLGRKRTVGVIDRLGLREDRSEPVRRLRDVAEVLDDAPLLDAPLLSLCRWLADYYVAPLGVVLKTALPPGLLGGRAERGATPSVKTERVLRLARPVETLTERDALFGRAPRQREAFETLESLGGEAAVRHLTGRLGFGRGVLDGLVGKGLASFGDRSVERDPFAGDGFPEGETRRLEPTAAQAEVLEGLSALATGPGAPGADGAVALLRGVTGSGKTVVYLELLARLRAAGRSGIVLVPEISLTPQTVARFRARFGDDVAVLHSGLSDGERHDAWRALKEGRKRVAIGPRSAVFAPVRDLGLIVVDEEHEGSYKQSDTPRYHARSVAAMRAQLEGCLCVLGSATPALESWENARRGRYHLFELGARVTTHGLPAVELVDLRAPTDVAEAPRAAEEEEPRARPGPANGAGGDLVEGERGPRIFSDRLRAGIADRLARGEQCILFLNRRGYASFVECPACSHVWSCGRCSVSLTYHRRRRRLVCHHCGFESEPPVRCGECGHPSPRYTGLGTEQVERRLGELFPAARTARMDLDTTGSKWAHFDMLDAFGRGEVDLLLGTQMIAKGLDFPGVTLVGVINADVGLHIPDFRASERTFQLLEQVAGRAGRGAEPGEVLVQTSRPRHFALACAASHDYVGFAERELEHRREPGYPPYRKLANLVISGRDENRVLDAAEATAEWTRALIADRGLPDIEVVGPAPCPIERLRSRWRWHFLVKSDLASTLGGVLRFLGERRGQPGAGLRLEIDRDPESLL